MGGDLHFIDDHNVHHDFVKGINYTNIELIHKIPHLTELNIGHSIVSRALFVGIEDAIKELLGAMADYPG